MDRALTIALRGWGRVSPNPMVGAVLLKGGSVVSEGFHAVYGGPHAEIAALAACPEPEGTTCVVNLEPCAHHGKTPPCTEALIAAKVRRVVIAMLDPHAEAGGGAKRLEAAGVEVEVGLCAQRAAALNAPFLWNVARPARPFVALKLATSIDGCIADADGKSRWISGQVAREYVQWLRAGFSAIGVGARTSLADDPQLTVRGPLQPRVPPARVLFVRSTPVPATLKMFESTSGARTIVVVPPKWQASVEAHLSGGRVELLVARDLSTALRNLKAGGITSILVEGGGRLGAALLGEDLVDRLYWIQSPKWLGSGIPAFPLRSSLALDTSPTWTPTERRSLGADTLLVVDRQLCLQGS